mmetsp:Transcript_29361/g.65734  ORF Transcript_29361/g.65734 Transcript_29361/m.65734 type:complete len:198 (+) Transcript_29361:967-1560(+)
MGQLLASIPFFCRKVESFPGSGQSLSSASLAFGGGGDAKKPDAASARAARLRALEKRAPSEPPLSEPPSTSPAVPVDDGACGHQGCSPKLGVGFGKLLAIAHAKALSSRRCPLLAAPARFCNRLSGAAHGNGLRARPGGGGPRERGRGLGRCRTGPHRRLVKEGLRSQPPHQPPPLSSFAQEICFPGWPCPMKSGAD